MSNTNSSEVPDGDDRIIIAIDFGTTFSGVGWATTYQPENRAAITTWPLSKTILDGEDSVKVPTRLRYVGPDDIEWGFQVPDDVPRNEVLEWFKLDLDPSMKIEGNKDVFNERSRPKDPRKPISDYLRGVGEHILHSLRKSGGGGGLLDVNILEFILTVPAVWTELATQTMIEACRQAGDPFKDAKIHVISEPEAAAMYTIHGLRPGALNAGDSFVICDAGGGTVDLISYTIEKVRPVLELKEAAAGEGAFCGSIFLNRRFEAFMRQKMAGEPSFSWRRFEAFMRQKMAGEPSFNDEAMAEALMTFEKVVKKRFSTASDGMTIPFRGKISNPLISTWANGIRLSAAELKGVFDPVIEHIEGLVKNQMAASKVAIRAILLVGGFGTSTYLRERLQHVVEDIEIIQPANAQLAVVHGAVMKGLAISNPNRLTVVKVRDRVARKHYGCVLGKEYQWYSHAAYNNNKYWDGFDGKWRIDMLSWFIKKGDTVSEEKLFTQRISADKLVSTGRFGLTSIEIYADDSGRQAPERQDDAVKELCKVTMDLSHIPLRDLTQKLGKDGLFYYVIEFDLEWVYHSQSTEFTLVHNGKRYDTVSVEYV